MKTPMQELIERVREYRDAEASPLVISRLNSILVDILGMLEKEKEFMQKVYANAKATGEMDEAVKTFNTKEK